MPISTTVGLAIGDPVIEPPAPKAVALIGDSLLYQGGGGEAAMGGKLAAQGWVVPSRFYFYACIGKTVTVADTNGRLTVNDMDAARAALDVEPDVWVIALGTNGAGASDAGIATQVNTVMNKAGTVPPRVIWIGLSCQTGQTDEADYIHFNAVAKPLVEARSNGVWADWFTYQRAIGDSGMWTSGGLHMTPAGYEVKNTFIAQAVGPA